MQRMLPLVTWTNCYLTMSQFIHTLTKYHLERSYLQRKSFFTCAHQILYWMQEENLPKLNCQTKQNDTKQSARFWVIPNSIGWVVQWWWWGVKNSCLWPQTGGHSNLLLKSHADLGSIGAEAELTSGTFDSMERTVWEQWYCKYCKYKNG